jgi:hypothetical protein
MPLASRSSRSDRDSAFLLLRHPIHGGGSFVHLTDFVRTAGVVQDAFGRSRFTGINVRHNADVAQFF